MVKRGALRTVATEVKGEHDWARGASRRGRKWRLVLSISCAVADLDHRNGREDT